MSEDAPSTGRFPSRRVLTGEQIQAIHADSLAVLERVGIIIEHRLALELLAEAGAPVDFKTQLVHIPGWLVEQSLTTVPASFLVAGLHPEHDLSLAVDSEPRARPVMSLDWIVDPGQKRRRQVTVQDLENWIRLADALPTMALVTGLYPWDVPIATRDVRAAQAMLELSGKPLLIAPYSGQNVRYIAQLLAAIPGQQPNRAIIFSSCNSPLLYSESQMDVLLAALDHNLPVMVNSSAVTGTTAPITLAGSLVLINAEILAAIVVTQLARPGAKVIYAGHPVFLDMRTGIASCGHTEGGLLAAALVELGHYYRMPVGSNGLTTDAHVCDEQAAIEKFATGYEAVLSGANLNGGAGSLAAVGTASLEQMVIDDDIYNRILRLRQGIAFSPATLAVEVIAEVGPMRHFLDHPHTLEYLRREFRFSSLACRVNPEVWNRQGSQDSLDLAAIRVRSILAEAPEPYLDEAVRRQLQAIVQQAEAEAR